MSNKLLIIITVLFLLSSTSCSLFRKNDTANSGFNPQANTTGLPAPPGVGVEENKGPESIEELYIEMMEGPRLDDKEKDKLEKYLKQYNRRKLEPEEIDLIERAKRGYPIHPDNKKRLERLQRKEARRRARFLRKVNKLYEKKFRLLQEDHVRKRMKETARQSERKRKGKHPIPWWKRIFQKKKR